MALSQTASARRIAIAAGGTGGHVNSGLALAEAYRIAVPDVELLFVGTANGVERFLVPKRGYRLELIRGTPFYGTSWLQRPHAAAMLAAGFWRARHLLRAERIELAIGLGGYASVGTLLAARSLRIPCAVHESSREAGRANRFLARFVDRVYVAFPGTAGELPIGKTRYVGMLVSALLRRVGQRRVAPPFGKRPIHLLVTGGTLGSPLLNRALPGVVEQLKKRGIDLEVWHQAGDIDRVPWAQRDSRFAGGDVRAIRAAYASTGVTTRVDAYVDNMAEAYTWADVAVSCGGTTLAELAAVALPAIVIPMSVASDDHQRGNAQAFAEPTGVWWCSEADFRIEEAVARLARLCTDVDFWKETSMRLCRLATNAAPDIVADCEAWLPSK
ncbi:MAG: UDP-N-acetylglucosamine--N-acetylmuramyl-(pentapeptide) pyrophosphoryl-undecaprenol N-acetylglucosamine transferase [Deltaproteobacteria bacterium]|nr:UDP-N-acetylglucosamine--N-acetylmuramyl-(pentapeptide) pyrophosphoryl-undecaprenol N-acetylglucosamine transferase [Deltaproteobacteria bacterium]